MKWLGFFLVTMIALLATATVWLGIVGDFVDLSPGPPSHPVRQIFESLAAIVVGLGGLAIIVRKHKNLVGWLLIGLALTAVLELFGARVATNACNIPTVTDCPVQIAVLTDMTFYFFLAMIIGLFLLFPHGELKTWPMRLMMLLTAVAVATGIIATTLQRGVHYFDGAGFAVVNPWHTGWEGWDEIGFGAVIGLMVLIGASVAMFGVRTARSRTAERQQFKWLAWAGVVAISGMALSAAADALGHDWGLGFVVGFLTIPIAIVMAITRHQLYDIDRLISRTIAYVVVIILLTAGFGAMIALPTVALGTSGDETTPDVLIAAATLTAFLLFNPLRRRVQSAVDRRFNRLPYDPTRVTEQLNHQVRDTVDPDALTTAWRDAAVASVQPTAASIWIRGTP